MLWHTTAKNKTRGELTRLPFWATTGFAEYSIMKRPFSRGIPDLLSLASTLGISSMRHKNCRSSTLKLRMGRECYALHIKALWYVSSSYHFRLHSNLRTPILVCSVHLVHRNQRLINILLRSYLGYEYCTSWFMCNFIFQVLSASLLYCKEGDSSATFH